MPTDNLEAWLKYQDSLRHYYIVEDAMSPEAAADRAFTEVQAEIKRRNAGNSKSRSTSPYHMITRNLFGYWRVEYLEGHWRATFRDRADALAFIEQAPEPHS